MISSVLCTFSVCDKNGNHTDNHRFLLRMNHKAMNKTLGQRFLKDLKATCKTSGDYELNQQKASYLKCTMGRLCTEHLNC